MYQVTIINPGEDKGVLKLRTEKRALARATLLLCLENEVACDVVVEAKPKTVKFKGID